MDVNCETVFLKELQKNKSIILTKENTRSARDKKRIAWMSIQRVLVATAGREYSVQQLCKKWNNLQQRVKEKIRNAGGDKIPKTLHERDMLCLQIIGPENLNIPMGNADFIDIKKDYDNTVLDPNNMTMSEDIPMVVNVTSLNEADNKMLDMMINSANNFSFSPNNNNNNTTNNSPKNKLSVSESQQVLDMVMNSSELKNNLVTSLSQSLTSLQNSMTSTSAAGGTSVVNNINNMNNITDDISLVDIDKIQTNIYNELANRINQINGSQEPHIEPNISCSTEDLASLVDNTPQAPTVANAPEFNSTHPDIISNKRKRRSSNLSASSMTCDPNIDINNEILTLKRDVLQLKKEKLQLKNEKVRMEIEAMKRGNFEEKGCQAGNATECRSSQTAHSLQPSPQINSVKTELV